MRLHPKSTPEDCTGLLLVWNFGFKPVQVPSQTPQIQTWPATAPRRWRKWDELVAKFSGPVERPAADQVRWGNNRKKQSLALPSEGVGRWIARPAPLFSRRNQTRPGPRLSRRRAAGSSPFTPACRDERPLIWTRRLRPGNGYLLVVPLLLPGSHRRWWWWWRSVAVMCISSLFLGRWHAIRRVRLVG